MKKFIYADNAATTKMSKAACEAMVKYQLEEFANASQAYSFARGAKLALKTARQTIAACIGAKPEEIFFTSGGTESNNWVIKGTAGNTVIVSSIEHPAILNPCKELEAKGKKIVYLPVTSCGEVLPEVLEEALSPGALVSVMTANNEIGTIQPIKELAAITHAHKAFFHTDAVQAVGHIKIDVKELGVDYLSASAHKFNGPKGIGFLYIRKGRPLPPLLLGGSQEFSRRAGTENIASIVAMAIALKENVEQLQVNEAHLRLLEKELITMLIMAGVSYAQNGGTYRTPGNISLSFSGISGEALLHRLDLKGICVSTGSACNSKEIQISRVLKAIRLDPELAKGTIRISLGRDNTLSEVRYIASALISILTA